MENYVSVGKLEAAKRHLRTAIVMFFERKDPVAIYTVAWSAYQILSDICKKAGIDRPFEDDPILDEFGVRKEVIRAFRKPRNFFHHADNDNEESVKFFPDMAFLIPLLATELLEKIEPHPFIPGKTLRLWFFINNPKLAPKEISSQIELMDFPPSPDDYDLFIDIMAKATG